MSKIPNASNLPRQSGYQDTVNSFVDNLKVIMHIYYKYLCNAVQALSPIILYFLPISLNFTIYLF